MGGWVGGTYQVGNGTGWERRIGSVDLEEGVKHELLGGSELGEIASHTVELS